MLAKKTTRRNKKKSLKQLKFKQADFEESYSPSIAQQVFFEKVQVFCFSDFLL